MLLASFNELIRNNEHNPQIRVSDVSPSPSDPPAKIGDDVTVTVSAEFFGASTYSEWHTTN